MAVEPVLVITRLAPKPPGHWLVIVYPTAHDEPPLLVGVAVGAYVGVAVGVAVGTYVGVAVGACVGVAVGVAAPMGVINKW